MVLYVGPLVYIFFILNPFKVNQPVTHELDEVKSNFSEDLNRIKTNQIDFFLIGALCRAFGLYFFHIEPHQG